MILENARLIQDRIEMIKNVYPGDKTFQLILIEFSQETSTLYTPRTQSAFYSKLKYIFEYFPGGLVDFNKENVLDFLEKNAGGASCTLKKSIYRLLVIMNKHNCLIDQNVVSLAKTLAQTKTAPANNILKKILTDVHPEYFTVVPFHTSTRESQTVLYINCTIKEIRRTVADFLGNFYNHNSTLEIAYFCENFSFSLNGYTVKQTSDFSFTTFKKQVHYFCNASFRKNKRLLPILIAFYRYLALYINPNIFKEDNIPLSILQKPNLGQFFNSGYEIIKYNPYEKFPMADKWFFFYKEHPSDSVICLQTIDFTKVESTIYRKWLKDYTWNYPASLNSKLHIFYALSKSLNYFSKLKKGTELSIFALPGNEDYITAQDILAFKNHLFSIHKNNRTLNSYIYNVRNLFQQAQNSGLGKIDVGAFYNLTHTLDQTYDNTRPIDDSSLTKVVSILKNAACNNILYSIYLSIFFLALETEFRISQILNLDLNCLRETAKKGEFVVISRTKTSAGEFVEQPISNYVEKEIRHVIALTQTYRKQCTNTEISNKLFIRKGKGTLGIVMINREEFNLYLKKCCTRANVEPFTVSNLRDTHMTKAEEFRIRNNLSDIEQNILTGHKSIQTDDTHYVKLDIREMLEAVHGITIGNITLEGNVLPTMDKKISTHDNEVVGGCGYCKNSYCNMLINLDCPMCKNFVTTVSRLPYFEEQIKLLDQQIMKATIPHDKEDLVNIKRLLLRYVEEILKVKEGIR